MNASGIYETLMIILMVKSSLFYIPQQTIHFPYVEGPEMTWTNKETMSKHFKTWKQKCKLI